MPYVAGPDTALLLSVIVSVGVTAGAMNVDPPPAVTLPCEDCPVDATGSVPNARRVSAERPASTILESPIYEDVKSCRREAVSLKNTRATFTAPT